MVSSFYLSVYHDHIHISYINRYAFKKITFKRYKLKSIQKSKKLRWCEIICGDEVGNAWLGALIKNI